MAELNAGTIAEDMIATDTDGKSWSVEVKKTRAITVQHREQAMRQAKARRLPWMLMSHVHGTCAWLVQRQGMPPTVWHAKEEA